MSEIVRDLYNDRLRESIRRLAEVPAETNVALSEEEHEALKEFIGVCESQAASAREGNCFETADRWSRKAAVVSSLLVRFGGGR